MKYLLLFFIFVSFCSVNNEQQKSPYYSSSPKTQVRTSSIKVNEDFEADKTLPNQNDSYDNKTIEILIPLNIKSLMQKRLYENDIEIRIWSTRGNTKTNGFILNRTNEKWQGFLISPEFVNLSKTFIYKKKPITKPNSGWEITWKKLLNEDILTLPDAKSIDCNVIEVDGSNFMFEIKKGKKYRTYSYSNPEYADKEKCPKNIKISNIFNILREEFLKNE